MSQAAFLRALAADMDLAFHEVGMADLATYQAPNSASVSDPFLVQFNQGTPIAKDGPPVGSLTTAFIPRASVEEPQRKGRLVIDGITWLLEAQFDEDQAYTMWTVVSERA